MSSVLVVYGAVGYGGVGKPLNFPDLSMLMAQATEVK